MPSYWNSEGKLVNGLMDVQLTGKNVELVSTPFNAQAVADTANNNATTISTSSLSKYKELFIKVTNNLRDAGSTAVVTNLKFYDNGIGFIASQAVTVTDATGAIQLIDKSNIKAMGMPGTIALRLAVQCTTAPTQGSITVLLYGIPN